MAAHLRPVAGIMATSQSGAATSASGDDLPSQADGPHGRAARSPGLDAVSRASPGLGR